MAGGGGAWKVAYADFVTAMMAFFMVMWIVAQGKSVKSAVSGYFRDPFGTESKPAGSGHAPGFVPRRKAAGKQDPNSLAKGSLPPAIAVLPLGDGGDVGSPVMFADDSAELDEAARDLLKEMAAFLRGKENRIELRGHTIRGPQRDPAAVERELKICFDRCTAVMNFLEAEQIKPSRFRLSQASHFEPRTESDDPLWRRRNSRVDVYLLSEYYDERKNARRTEAEHEHDAQHDHDAEHEHDAEHQHDAGGHADAAPRDAAAHDAGKAKPAADHAPAHADDHGTPAKHGAAATAKPASAKPSPADHGHDPPPAAPARPSATAKPTAAGPSAHPSATAPAAAHAAPAGASSRASGPAAQSENQLAVPTAVPPKPAATH